MLQPLNPFIFLVQNVSVSLEGSLAYSHKTDLSYLMELNAGIGTWFMQQYAFCCGLEYYSVDVSKVSWFLLQQSGVHTVLLVWSLSQVHCENVLFCSSFVMFPLISLLGLSVETTMFVCLLSHSMKYPSIIRKISVCDYAFLSPLRYN
jgi:hypothetical protein